MGKQKQSVKCKEFVRVGVVVFAVLVLVYSLNFNGFPQANVILGAGESFIVWRDLSGFVDNSTAFNVVLEMATNDSLTAFGISETVPSGWTVTWCSEGNFTFLDGIMELLIFSGPGSIVDMNISYTVVPNSNSGIFSGTWETVDPEQNGSTSGDSAIVISGCTDEDEDGYSPDGGSCGLFDCDDYDDTTNPGKSDNSCDGVDNDCSGVMDEDYVSVSTTCGVGMCVGGTGMRTCSSGVESDSCDPSWNASAESCEDDTGYDGSDQACDGTPDLDCSAYCDQDEDGYAGHTICLPVGLFYGWSLISLDCNDTSGLINPSAINIICNGLDEDCSGEDNEGTDNDGDGYTSEGGFSCDGNLDCADSESDCNIYLGSAERSFCIDNLQNINVSADDNNCNGVDEDCNGLIDNPGVDSDGDGVGDNCEVCEGSPYVSGHNVTFGGCILPMHNKFSSSLTTNFWNYGNLRNVDEIKLGIESIGAVFFLNKSSLNIEAVDFDSYVNILMSSIALDVSNLSFLENESAKLHFYNIGYVTPRLLRNGIECVSPQCNRTSYISGTLVYDISGFSTYSVEEAYVSPVVDSSGGGGSSAGGASAGGASTVACATNWSCNDWSICADGVQIRECIDIAACGIEEGKPSETEVCDCIEDWSCEGWIMVNGRETRNCIDLNGCGTIVNRPAVTKSVPISGYKWLLIGLFAVIVVISVAIYIVIKKQAKKGRVSSSFKAPSAAYNPFANNSVVSQAGSASA